MGRRIGLGLGIEGRRSWFNQLLLVIDCQAVVLAFFIKIEAV